MNIIPTQPMSFPNLSDEGAARVSALLSAASTSGWSVAPDARDGVLAQLMYVAALLPEGCDRAEQMAGVLGSPHVDAERLRMLFAGRDAKYAAALTSLLDGETTAAAAGDAGLGHDRVRAMSAWLGLRARTTDDRFAFALALVEDGHGVAVIAAKLGIGRAAADQYARRARAVIAELA